MAKCRCIYTPSKDLLESVEKTQEPESVNQAFFYHQAKGANVFNASSAFQQFANRNSVYSTTKPLI